MNPDKPIEYAKAMLALAVEQLKKEGSITNCFHLITPTETQVVAVLGNEMNDPNFKDKLALDLRARIQDIGAIAYVMVSDTFRAHMSTDDPIAMKKELIRQALQLTLQQAAEVGLCEVIEAISVVCETKDGKTCQIMQEYVRDPADTNQVTIQSEPEIMEDYVIAGGRFMGMWKPPMPGSLHSDSEAKRKGKKAGA